VRFVTDGRVFDQQLTANRRRLRFEYSPENPPEILGKDISSLGAFENLAMNFAELLSTERFGARDAPIALEILLLVNGVKVATIHETAAARLFTDGQAVLQITDQFKSIAKVNAERVGWKR